MQIGHSKDLHQISQCALSSLNDSPSLLRSQNVSPSQDPYELVDIPLASVADIGVSQSVDLWLVTGEPRQRTNHGNFVTK